jgi:hypothetical protein
MNWQSHLISRAELEAFWPPPNLPADNLAAAARALLAQQQQSWPQLRQATAGLQQVEYKEFKVKSSRVLAQFNPQRIVSTAAKVDAASIQARPCFLCAANLPVEERGLPFGEHYIVLGNPFPVLPQHLVIAARAHTPQAIAASVGALLDLTQALGAEFFTLYNGPRCGASAPDHLHFQAAASATLPIWAELNQGLRLRPSRWPGLDEFTLAAYRIHVLGARSAERGALLAWFQQRLSALAQLTQTTEEPLLNILATYEAGNWSLLLLPRQRHRPACFDAEGEARLTISPAAIDLGGVLVVPQAEHFARLTETILTDIYAEVTLAEPVFQAWLQWLE